MIESKLLSEEDLKEIKMIAYNQGRSYVPHFKKVIEAYEEALWEIEKLKIIDKKVTDLLDGKRIVTCNLCGGKVSIIKHCNICDNDD